MDLLLLLLLLPFHINLSSFMCIMKLLFFIVFCFAFVDHCVCSNDEAIKYLNCSTNILDCGVLGSIRYPFWGTKHQVVDRPDFCGLPDFYLNCSRTTPYISINNQQYSVLRISKQKKTMRIVDSNFLSYGNCPWSDKGITSLDFRPFEYSEGVMNITIFSGCNDSYMQSLNQDFTSNFSCPGNFENGKTGGYYFETTSLFGKPRQNLPTCRYNITVPVMKTFLNGIGTYYNLSAVLGAGFDVSYDAAVDISTCKICEESGGQCGYEKRLYRTACFCPDGKTSMRTSTRNGTTQRCARVSGGGHLEKKILIGTTGAVSFVLVLLLLVLVIFFKKKQRERKKDQQIVEAFYKNQGSLALKRYKYFEVKKMTNSFKEKLGEGGYGSVFKGNLKNGHPIAVKLLFTNSKNNGEEFINEVESISQTSHVNVVNLLGFCLEGKKRALIYEFMQNGSLEKFIYNNMMPLTSGVDHHHSPQLGVDTLYQIAIGIANGLDYLHRGCNTRILHFDIKPHNILLDEKFCPKIADFGLAKLCTRNESMISFLGMRGTTGYIAPEVFSRKFGGVSYKSDVYSYGMMILEMVGGRRNVDVGLGMDHSSQLYYPDWIYQRLKQNNDIKLHGVIMREESEEIARKMIIVGLWCIETNPKNRPSMTKVLEMLEGKSEILQLPPKPLLSSPSRTFLVEEVTSPTAVLNPTQYFPSGTQPASSSSVVSMSYSINEN